LQVFATTLDGFSVWDEEWFTVAMPPSPRSPRAYFTENTHALYVGEAVSFDASGSEAGFDGDDTCPITSYAWDFGDGNTTTVTVPTITHVYTTAGNYVVTLNVTAPGIQPYIHSQYVSWNTTSASKSVMSPPPPTPPWPLSILNWWQLILLGLVIGVVIASAAFLAARPRKEEKGGGGKS